MTHKTINDKAQEIQDYFFARGASVSRQDWEWLLTTLTNVQENQDKIKSQRLNTQEPESRDTYDQGYADGVYRTVLDVVLFIVLFIISILIVWFFITYIIIY